MPPKTFDSVVEYLKSEYPNKIEVIPNSTYSSVKTLNDRTSIFILVDSDLKSFTTSLPDPSVAFLCRPKGKLSFGWITMTKKNLTKKEEETLLVELTDKIKRHLDDDYKLIGNGFAQTQQPLQS